MTGQYDIDDVFVPDSDVLGEPGAGWSVAMSTAGNERGLALRSPGRFCAAADRLLALRMRNIYGIVELPPEDVPPMQNKIVARARQLGKPVVVATQMLESMTTNPQPTSTACVTPSRPRASVSTASACSCPRTSPPRTRSA